jgi:hypothetical protein
MNKAPIEGYEFKIVRVMRNLDTNLKSALLHYDVREYCGPTIETASRMLISYDEAAQWQCRASAVNHFLIQYEDVLKNPSEIIMSLANFVGCKDQTSIASAINSIKLGRSIYR